MGVGDVVGTDIGMAGMIEEEDVDADEYTGSVVGNTGDTEDVIVVVGEDLIVVFEEDTVVTVEVDAVVAVEGVADTERDVWGVTDLLHDCLLLYIDFEYSITWGVMWIVAIPLS